VLGWAVKGGIGYTGTIAMGKAAIRYFEEGADLGQLTAYFATLRDKAAASARQRRMRSGAGRALASAPQELPPVVDSGAAEAARAGEGEPTGV
jgi:hypothetical protein